MKKDEKKINGKKKDAEKQPYSDVRVFIAVPSTSVVHADMAMCLAALGNHCTSLGIRIALNNLKSADITHARNCQVAEAIKKKATHIFFVDSDMIMPPWAIQRCLDVMQRTGDKIVGVTVPKRLAPFYQVAKGVDGERLKIEINDERDLVETSSFGTGMVMIDMAVFEEVEFPWFDAHYEKDEHGKQTLGTRISEDVSFFRKAKAEGFKVMCDVPLSKDTQHIGEMKFDYTSEDFFADAVELRRQKAQDMIAQAIDSGNVVLKEAANG